MKNPSVTYIMSWPHATAIIKKMNQKKHRDAGYYFELFDPDCELYDRDMPDGKVFANYKSSTQVVQLKIFFEAPNGR